VGPVLGLKVIFVALLESLVKQQSIGAGVYWGALVSLLGITFSSQTDRWSLHPRELLRPGVALMIGAALCLGVSDMFVRATIGRWHGDSWAVARYIALVLGLCAAFGLALLPVVGRAVKSVERICKLDWTAARALWWTLLLCAVSIFCVQYFFFTSIAVGQRITVTNILYNTRGLFLVAMAAFLTLSRGSHLERAGWRAYTYRAIGVLLTLGAIALVMRK
jgi:hypothetical protein